MSYGAFLGILLFLLVSSWIWMLLVKKGQAIFIKRINKYILFALLLFLVLGSGGGLLRKVLKYLLSLYPYLLQAGFLALGILHLHKLNTSFQWKEDKFIPLRISFTVFLGALLAVIFFVAQWVMEWKIYKTPGKLADNYTTTMLIGLVPLFFDWAHRVWNQIPIVSKSFEPYQLPIDQDPPVFEPSTQIIRLIIQVPYRFQAMDSISLTVAAPLVQTLGHVFHHIMDEHNNRRRSPKPIEIAEENKRSKLYGWLFYKLEKRWWGMQTKKVYLPYNQVIKQTGLEDRDTVYVERIKTW